MFAFLTIVAIVVIAFLGWNLYRRFGSDRIGAFMERRQKTAKFVSRAVLVDGNRHLDVVLALEQSTLFYENSETEGSLDLRWISEIVYDNELGTGGAVPGGKVLRLRSQSQTFEFVLADDVVARWHTMLPASSSPAKQVAV